MRPTADISETRGSYRSDGAAFYVFKIGLHFLIGLCRSALPFKTERMLDPFPREIVRGLPTQLQSHWVLATIPFVDPQQSRTSLHNQDAAGTILWHPATVG